MATPGDVPPGLARLLEESATRSVNAYNGVRGELEGLREDQRLDRQRDDQRFAALEAFRDEVREDLEALARELGEVKRNSAALVIAEHDPETGETTVTAKPARLGLDGPTIVGALVALVTTGLVPVLLVILK